MVFSRRIAVLFPISIFMVLLGNCSNAKSVGAKRVYGSFPIPQKENRKYYIIRAVFFRTIKKQFSLYIKPLKTLSLKTYIHLKSTQQLENSFHEVYHGYRLNNI